MQSEVVCEEAGDDSWLEGDAKEAAAQSERRKARNKKKKER